MYKFQKLYYTFQKVGNVTKIYLYDDIQEHGEFNWETYRRDESETSAKHFQKLLDEVPENGEIELYINSNGGSVKEGTAIYNKLKRHPAHITGYVDGVAHSIAFTILQACDKRIMGEGTSVLLHNMWAVVAGNADELRNEADKLDAWMKASRNLILQRTDKISEEELTEMMSKETLLGPDEALQYGFIDEIEQREKVKTEEVVQAGENMKKVKKALQQSDFDDVLREFEEIAKDGEGEQEKEGSILDSFFNIFLQEER